MTGRNYYRLGKIIGQGGMAAVYQAEDTTRHQTVALKVLLPHLQDQPEFVERFWREARNAARLQHPHIVPVYDQGTLPDGRPYMAMAWVEGGSLADLLARQGGPLPPAQAVAILVQVAAALDYAHGQGVVHRDVKPSNILLTGNGQALLTDFGIAQAVWDSRLTLTGAHMGTPAYMAPEQALGQGASPATDLYALGVVLYEMLTGRPPFQGETPAMLYQHTHEPPPPLRSRNPALPAALEPVLGQALAKDPRRRYRTAGELAAAVRAALPAATPAALTRPTADVAPLLAVLAGLLLVGILVSGVVWMVTRARPTPTPIAQASTVAMLAPPTASPVAPPTSSIASTTTLSIALAEPVDGQSFPAGRPVTLRWSAPLGADEHFLVALRGEGASMLAGTWPVEGSEYQLPVLPPNTYTWLVSVRKGEGGEAQEISRSKQGKFIIAAAATPIATPVLPATATPPPPAASPTATPPTQPAAPQLVSPEDNERVPTTVDMITFRWKGTYGAGQGFEIRLWRDRDDPVHPGACDARQTTEQARQAADGSFESGCRPPGEGTYYWTVAVVQLEPYSPIGPEAPPRVVIYGKPEGGDRSKDEGGKAKPIAP